MSGPTWVMFQCSSCDRFSGARKGQKSMMCSHCGDRERLSVIREFSNSSSLSQAISLENTPPEIRKELDNYYSEFKYYDAPYEEFGMGATEILLRG